MSREGPDVLLNELLTVLAREVSASSDPALLGVRSLFSAESAEPAAHRLAQLSARLDRETMRALLRSLSEFCAKLLMDFVSIDQFTLILGGASLGEFFASITDQQKSLIIAKLGVPCLLQRPATANQLGRFLSALSSVQIRDFINPLYAGRLRELIPDAFQLGEVLRALDLIQISSAVTALNSCHLTEILNNEQALNSTLGLLSDEQKSAFLTCFSAGSLQEILNNAEKSLFILRGLPLAQQSILLAKLSMTTLAAMIEIGDQLLELLPMLSVIQQEQILIHLNHDNLFRKVNSASSLSRALVCLPESLVRQVLQQLSLSSARSMLSTGSNLGVLLSSLKAEQVDVVLNSLGDSWLATLLSDAVQVASALSRLSDSERKTQLMAKLSAEQLRRLVRDFRQLSTIVDQLNPTQAESLLHKLGEAHLRRLVYRGSDAGDALHLVRTAAKPETRRSLAKAMALAYKAYQLSKLQTCCLFGGARLARLTLATQLSDALFSGDSSLAIAAQLAPDRVRTHSAKFEAVYALAMMP